MFIGSVFTIIVSMYRGDTCLLACCDERHDHCDADEPKAEEPQQVAHRSRHNSQPAQLAQTPGAGPSRTPSCSAPRQAAQPPPRTTKVPQTTPATREYDIATIRKGGYDYPDPTLVKWRSEER